MAAARLAGETDIEAAAGLMAEFHDVEGAGRPDDETLRAGVARLIRAGEAEFFLIGQPAVGVAEVRYRWSLFSQAEDAYLEDLYVRVAHRRQGLGRALVEAAITRARERGAVRMELGASEGDTEATAFYEALGFENRFEDPDGHRALLYSRWVSEPPPWQAGKSPV